MDSAPDSTSDSGSAPLLAIGLIGASTLLLEILLTRIFSVTMWYHFAFVAISLALFGVAASGVSVSLAPRFFRRERALTQMGLAALFAGVTISVSFVLDLAIPFVPFDIPGESPGAGIRLLPYLLFFSKFTVLSLPFLGMGLVIALSFTHFPRQVHRVYFADLAGGGLGCLAVVPLLNSVSGPSAVIFVSALAFLAAGLFLRHAESRRLSTVALLGVLVVCVAVVSNERFGWLAIERVKSYDPGEAQTVELPKIYERWHPVSRVVVHPLEVSGSPWHWFYDDQAEIEFPPVMEVTNDAGARTYLYPRMSQSSAVELFRHDASDLVYSVTERPKVLIVGIGGGKDVLSALALGAEKVTAVELNPLMIDIVQDTFRDFTGAPFDDPRVETVVGEGRNFIASRDRLYDVIKISVTDTWAASAVGAYAMTENYLYTLEALDEFRRHLEPGGLLSIVRWYPQESMRLVAMARESLLRAGYTDAEERIVMARNPSVVNVVLKNGVFEPAEAERFRNAAHGAGLSFLGGGGLEPDLGAAPEKTTSTMEFFDHAHWLALSAPDRGLLAEQLPFGLEPATDDRPFFFNPVALSEVDDKSYYSFGGFTFQHGRALTLLLALLKITLAVALLFVLGPLLLRGFAPWKGIAIPIRIYASLYFLMLGLGYLLIEIPLLQQFILFLGHPTYAVTVVLLVMLVSSGVGSLLAQRVLRLGNNAPWMVFAAVVVLLVALVLFLPTVLRATIGLPLAARMLISTLAIAPVGVLLGMPFPIGVTRLHGGAAPLVSWAWAVNGAASVAAPVLAMIVAIVSGFSTALFLGAACYLLAAPLLMLLGRELQPG